MYVCVCVAHQSDVLTSEWLISIEVCSSGDGDNMRASSYIEKL